MGAAERATQLSDAAGRRAVDSTPDESVVTEVHDIMSKRSTSLAAALLRRFARDESAATAIEYALIASGISIVIAASVFSVGNAVKSDFTSVSTALK